jgi:hypothetical protein
MSAHGGPQTGPAGGPHDVEALGAHAFGLLDDAEAGAVEAHVAGCDACRRELAELRATVIALDEIPSEALLDGPPEGGDVLLARTLRRMREESGERPAGRWMFAAAAAVVAVGAVLAGGITLGSAITSRDEPPSAAPTPAVSATPPGTRQAEAGDPVTGARMAVTVTPAPGWVRVSAQVRGIDAGERCQLLVEAADGTTELAASWLVSPAGERNGTQVAGSAIVPPDRVVAIVVANEAGRRFVRVPV